MWSWCSNVSKYTWIKVSLIAIFVLVNVALYTQSKHIILDAIVSQFVTNNTVLLVSGPINNSSKVNSNVTVLRQHNLLNNSTTQAHLLQTTFTSEMPFFRDNIVNPHNFTYVITPNVTCSGREVELVICVAVSHDNFEGRKIVRSTWGSYAYNISNKAFLVFFIGSKSNISDSSKATTKQDNVLDESLTFGDILQEDFIDSYNNLSLKSVSILKWVSSLCSNTKFILKVDDDMYVNIPFLVETLRQQSNQKAFIMGSMQENAHPIRNPSSKWYTPISMYSENTYPNYVSGTAYAMTARAAVLLYQASLRVPTFWLEDIYITGLCARKASVAVINSGYFSYGKPKASGCSFRKQISGHRYTHQEIVQIHKELYDPNLRC